MSMLKRRLDGAVHALILGVRVFGTFVAEVAWALVQRHGEMQTPLAQAA
jgi:hypothetical protein